MSIPSCQTKIEQKRARNRRKKGHKKGMRGEISSERYTFVGDFFEKLPSEIHLNM